MRFLVLDNLSDYWLQVFYQGGAAGPEHPGLADQPYARQMDVIYNSNQTAHLCWALRRLGHEVQVVYANCATLQTRWAAEHGLSLPSGLLDVELVRKGLGAARRVLGGSGRVLPARLEKVWQAQLAEFKPDVVYCVSMQTYPMSFLAPVQRQGACLVGQIASQYRTARLYRGYDLVFSSLPNFVADFRSAGINTAYLPLGFGEEVLAQLDPAAQGSINRVVHIGGYGVIHRERNQVLEPLARAGLLDCFGYSIELVEPASPLHAAYHGPVAGREYYRLRHAYTVSVTKHIGSVAGPYVNNTSLFEVTGVGACLLVDEKTNLADFFVPGVEVVTYHTPAECLDQAQYLLSHPQERQAIAAAGQQRTLRDHTMGRRVEAILQHLETL